MKIVSKSVAAGLLLAASLVAISLVAVSSVILPVQAQEGRNRAAAPDNTPLGNPNMETIIRGFGLSESALPAREFIKGWRKPKKVIVYLDNNTHRLEWLKQVVPADVELIGITRDDPKGLEAIKDADAQIGNCSKAAINAAGPNFHWLHHTGVGVDQCFTAADGTPVPARLKDGTLAVTNSARLEGNSVAGHGIAMMMALSRGIDVYARQDVTKKFTTETYPRMWSLQGRTILIAGLGGVGSGMANLAHGLGMRVIATNNSIPANPPDYIEHIGLPGELEAMVGQADVVMTALPLTAQTTGIFNKALFAKFKKGAMFINVTREEEHVEADLVEALNSGQLSSAGFDYISDDSALYTTKNVLITPHVAAQNVDSTLGRNGETIWSVARENLRRYVNGDKMISVVDPVKGY